MDEQRAWIQSRRRKRFRIAAVVLSICVLATNYPDIWGTLSAFAEETRDGDDTVYVTGFASLSEEMREQTVPVGTGVEELMLPDTLEAFAAIPKGEALPEDAEEETEASVESTKETPPEGTGEETESQETEGTETEESADHIQPEEETDVLDNGDNQTEKSQGTEQEASEEAFAKLAAWVEIAEQIAENSMAMAAVESGSCGDNLTWTLDDAGTLTISGTGNMKYWYSENVVPWNAQRANIKSVVINNGVANIGNYAFTSCKSLTNVDIPDSVTSIGQEAFGFCEGLTSVDIPDSVTSIGQDAFASTGLTSVDIPDSVTKINDQAFMACSNLQSVKLPKSLNTINLNAFRGCEKLTSINIPDSVTSIGMQAFSFTGLTSVDIPANVTSIDMYAFEKCSSLTKIIFTGLTPPKLGRECLKNSACLSNNGIWVPCSWGDSFATTDNGWETYKDNVTKVHGSLTVVPERPATCTETGIRKHWKCSVCGALFLDEGGTQTTTEADLIIGTSDHVYTYSATDNVITETCQNCNTHTATATLTLKDGADLTYTGNEITPLKVERSDNWAGSQPAIAYSANINAGIVSAGITYGGAMASTTFTIAPKPLTAGMITLASGPFYYTGSEIKPAVTVKDGGTTLVSGTDYTVSYENNVNVGTGTATVKIDGTGNYAGTLSGNFTIEYRQLPSGSLTNYVTISPEPTNGWYGSDITLTPKDGCEVGETPAGMGSNAVTISDETGTSGSKKTIYVKDSNGNIYQTEFSYKLDKTPPEVDLTDMTVENGTTNLLNWIIGKKSMIIKIPVSDVTDVLSGVEEVTYTAQPDNGTAQSGTPKEQDGYYQIALNAQFSGTIQLTVKDNAGNTTNVSLTADSGKVIAEDYPPVVTFVLPDTPQPNENGWYNTAVTITVTVTDNKDSGSADILSGGISAIQWKDGESGAVQTVTGLPGDSPVCEKEFTITVDTDGTHTYYIKAFDNAGNVSAGTDGWQSITVKVDTGNPEFSGDITVTNLTKESAVITFTPSEGGKVYYIVSDTGTTPTAQEVKEQSGQSGQKGGVQDVAKDTPSSFTIKGLTPGEKHTAYVVLEDAAGNLSEVRTESFFTLQEDKIVLRDDQMQLNMPGFSYGAQTLPNPRGSITVTDTNPTYTYLYSTDNGASWVTADRLPKSDSGYLIPGEYRVKMTYMGDLYTGGKTVSFTVEKNVLTVLPGTLAVQDKNYDGTTDAVLKEGGQPVLSGVAAGDTVILGGSLNAVFTEKGPKKNIPVAVTGFVLEGKDAGYYTIKNETLTLYATINNADGTPPAAGGNSGGDRDDHDDGDRDGNGGGDSNTSGDNNGSGTPAAIPTPVMPPTAITQPAPGTDAGSGRDGGTKYAPGTAKGDAGVGDTDNKKNDAAAGNTDRTGQDGTDPVQTEGETSQTLQASIEGGKLTIAGDFVATGNITETSETRTILKAGDGAVIVTVICEEKSYTAGVKDTVAVANAVLSPEQIQLVNDGETIEIRVDVTDISETVPGQDKEIIESGLAAYRKERPGLTLGMYVDISMFIKVGTDDWNAITKTEEPIDVVVGIPEELKGDGREFAIIRSHDGTYTLLPDLDDYPDTITISTDLFSAYAIAYEQAEGNTKCGLCHICPTFLGVCCFIWLAAILAVFLIVWTVIRRKREEVK